MSQQRSASPADQTGSWLASIAAHGGGLAVLIVAGILSVKTGTECHSTIICTYANAPFLPSFLRALVVWYWWAIVALVLWAWSKRSAKPLSLKPSVILAQLAAGCLLAGLHMALLSQVVLQLSRVWPTWGRFFLPFPSYSGERFSLDLTIYAFIFISSSLIRSQVDARRASMQSSELQRQLSQAQLQALQMQLEPHLLSNTLNSISSLVDLHRNGEASEAIAHLNTILRTALERGTPAKVPLHEDVKAFRATLPSGRCASPIASRFTSTRLPRRLRVLFHPSFCSRLLRTQSSTGSLP